jgi:glutamate racemase
MYDTQLPIYVKTLVNKIQNYHFIAMVYSYNLIITEVTFQYVLAFLFIVSADSTVTLCTHYEFLMETLQLIKLHVFDIKY